MGCHTWIYCHIPEKQEYLKNEITEQGISWNKEMLKYYRDPENQGILQKEFHEFHEECLDFIMDWETASTEEIIQYFGSLEKGKSELEWTKKAVDWGFPEYHSWLIESIEKELQEYQEGKIPEHGSLEDYSINPEYGNICYRVVGDKIYIDHIIPHGDDLGRIEDYLQPDCWSSDETIECFKKNGVPYDEPLIRELFKDNDIFIQFG